MDKVEQIARAICAADDKDPDQTADVGQTGEIAAERSPNWHLYRREANRIVASFEELTVGETGTGDG